MPGVLVPRAPSGLYGRLFRPGHRDVVQPGRLRFEGWLAWAGDEHGGVRVTCEDSVLGSTERFLPIRDATGLPMPDDLRAEAQRWAVEADLSRLPDGEHCLQVEVDLSDTGWTVLDAVCVVVSASEIGGRPLGGITNLSDGVQAPRGPITVTGTALHAAGPVRAVVVNLDRLAVARAMVDRPSPDAAKQYPTLPWAAKAGWQAEVDLSLADGPTTNLNVDALLPGDEWIRLDSLAVHIRERA